MRKEAIVRIDADNRDKGRVYKITEMDASRGEEWATRLLLAIARSGVEMPIGFLAMGWEAIAYLGINALGGLTWADAKPLLDEMMACVQKIEDPSRPEVVRMLVENDIEEVATRLRLRDEVFALHTGFSVAARLSNAISMRLAAQTQPGTDGGTASPNTRTSAQG